MATSSTSFGYFLKPLLAVVIIGGFFFVYNTYIVDRSLQALETSLSMTATAKSFQDVGILSVVLDEVLMEEVTKKNLDSERVAGLRFAQSVASEAQDSADISDAVFVLGQVVNEKKAKRFFLLKWVDALMAALKRFWAFLGLAFESEEADTSLRPVIAKDKVRLEFLSRVQKVEEEGDFEKSATLLGEFVQLYPAYEEIGEVKLRLARAYLRTRKYDLAEAMVQSILETKGRDSETAAARLLGEKIRTARNADAEITKYKQRIAAERSPERRQLVFLDLGKLALRFYRYPEAQDAFLQASLIQPQSPEARQARLNLGTAYVEDRKYDQAVELFLTMLTEDLDAQVERQVKLQLSDTYYKKGDYERAAKIYQDVALKNPEWKGSKMAKFQAGHTLVNKAKSIQQGAEIMSDLDEDAMFGERMETARYQYLNEGFELLQNGSLKGAEEMFQAVLRMDPGEAWAYSGLSNALTSQGRFQEGYETARRGVHIREDGFTRAALGFNALMQGDYALAIEHYEKAVSLYPKFVLAWYNLGFLYASIGELDKAGQSYERALDANPEFALAHNSLGSILWQRGDAAGAESEFRKALTIDATFMDAQYNLALLHLSVKRYEEARTLLTQLQEKDPNFRDVRQRLKVFEKLDNLISTEASQAPAPAAAAASAPAPGQNV